MSSACGWGTRGMEKRRRENEGTLDIFLWNLAGKSSIFFPMTAGVFLIEYL